MPTSARWEVANSPKISEKSAHSAGPMWASAPTGIVQILSYTVAVKKFLSAG